MLVLDGCFFCSILYAVEVFGDISCVADKLRLYEQKALRAILKVKKGTSTDLIYNELKRPDVISRILDNQYNFYQKVKNLKKEDAVITSILELCKDTPIVHYYESLLPDNKEKNIRERETRILQSTKPMTVYYTSVVDVLQKSNVYSNYVDDRFRCVITRWRLSNHKLRIETGRYHIPYIERNDRVCFECGVLEDEKHAIYDCPAFGFIRQKYTDLLEKYSTVMLIFNPDPLDIIEVSNFLSEIDKVLNKR